MNEWACSRAFYWSNFYYYFCYCCSIHNWQIKIHERAFERIKIAYRDPIEVGFNISIRFFRSWLDLSDRAFCSWVFIMIFIIFSFQKRDVLTRLKQARDSLRFDNTKLKHKAGLLGNKPLLRDFEDRKDEVGVYRHWKLYEIFKRCFRVFQIL